MPAPFPLTDQQARARGGFLSGSDLAIEAGAGTGKTSTLMVLGYAAFGAKRRGIYLAYNSAMAQDARKKLPRNVECRTTHSLAYRWLCQQWGEGIVQDRLRAPRLRTQDSAKVLAVATVGIRINDDVMLSPSRLISVAMETVRNFCYSSDRIIKKRHVPRRPRMDDDASHEVLAQAALPVAQRAWEELTTPKGRLRLEHDHYLKSWSLTGPTIPCDFLFLDEAQDTNPVVAAIVANQTHAQRVAVGDSCQAIYSWRGATDYLSTWAAQPDVEHLFLSTSFRFGARIAEWANMWLTLLNAELRITGTPTVDSQVRSIPAHDLPDAVLCRSNTRAVEEVIGFHKAGVKVCLTGRAEDVKRLAQAAIDLQSQGFTFHPELVAFTSWDDVVRYVDEAPDGGDLSVAVKLIEEHGPAAIIDAIEKCVDPESAQVAVSTAHSAKGREWGRVRIADDFKDPRDGDVPLPMQPEEMRLAYVAVTRARQVLDPDGLAFVVDRYRDHQTHMAAAARLVNA